jgi:hypothetical protein
MSTTGIIVPVVVVIVIALIVAATWGWGSCDAVDCDTGSARSTTERLRSAQSIRGRAQGARPRATARRA